MENEALSLVSSFPGGWWGFLPSAFTAIVVISRVIVADIVKRETSDLREKISQLTVALAELRREIAVRNEK